ncbi:MAG: hypothetical protein SF097_21425 [Acidobacteriota bacterium]|nr:hypothetical protein [Acidobacteriota bacterium]
MPHLNITLRKVVALFMPLIVSLSLMHFGRDLIWANIQPRSEQGEKAASRYRPLPASAGLPSFAIYRIELRQPATHLYTSTENVEVKVFSDRSGGGLENDLGFQTHNVPQGDSSLNLGRVPKPGVYFTRYKVGGETFVNGFLVLPANGNRFTVEIIVAPVTAVNLNPTTNAAFEKFFRNLDVNRLKTAATAVAPGWFALNGQNFLVQTAKGIVLAYSGLGFVAIFGQGGIGQELFALSLDFIATALARAADDMQILTGPERDAVKQAIIRINGLTQTLLADGIFQKVVTLGQGLAEATLGQDPDSQMTAKVTGDSLKKFHVLIGLKPR